MGTILSLLAAAAAVAPPANLPASYSLICEGTEAVGFDWRNGEWARTNFREETYVFEVRKENRCFNLEAGDEKTYGGVRFRAVCGNFRALGSQHVAILSNVCHERYSSLVGDAPISIECSRGRRYFAASPDGRFQMTTMHASVGDRPKDDYKDSILVTVGRCTMMR